MGRDDFDQKTKRELEYRVNCRCSNPSCRKTTSGPMLSATGFIRTGEAAHIYSASPGGKRYNPEMSSDERKSISNGIWLCENCHKLIDSDEYRYTPELLRAWKAIAEEEARIRQTNSNPNIPFSRTSNTKKHTIRIFSIFLLFITVFILPVLLVYWLDIYVGLSARILYYLAIVFLARIALTQIETKPSIAAACFGTITEEDLLQSPNSLYNNIVGVFGPQIFISKHKNQYFTSYYILKRLEFGSWDEQHINYLKVRFRLTPEWYDPSVLYIHALSQNRQAVQMLIRQGFRLQPDSIPSFPQADYLTKNNLHILLFYRRKRIDYMVIYQCEKETFIERINMLGV